MKFLNVATSTDVFGKVSPPPGLQSFGGDPRASLGNLIGLFLNLFIVFLGFVLLIYALWGAFDWITSGGEKEKITHAQQKITQAVIGFILVFVVFSLFVVITGNVLHIIDFKNGGWNINLPSVGNTLGPAN